MKLQYSKKFLKMRRKLSVENRAKVDKALFRFRTNPFDPPLRNHQLRGNRSHIRAISGGFDLRILYAESGGHVVVLLLQVGTHDQVY